MAGDIYALLDALAGIVEPPVAMAAAIGDHDELFENYDLAKEASRFEFGSIGKTMTAQILAALVLDGTVTLDDTIGAWLDAGENANITLRELATHTSGLPRMADNSEEGDDFDPADPYAHYTAELAEAALRVALRRPERNEEYSNFGYQLLGVCLERAAARPFAELLDEHVFTPLGLTTATSKPNPNQVQGYFNTKPTPAWTILLGGPGGVCGTLADLIAWGRAVLRPNEAMTFAIDNGLGWSRVGDDIVWHNGGTYGSHASLFVDPKAKRFAATLVATGDIGHVDDATLLACQGKDPYAARPQPAGDEHNTRAVTFLEHLVAQRWTDAHEMMTEDTRVALTLDRIEAAWQQVMDPRGEYVDATVVEGTRTGDNTELHLGLSFKDGTGTAILNFNAEGLLYGVRIG